MADARIPGPGLAKSALFALGLIAMGGHAGHALQVAATTSGPGVGKLGSTKPRFTIPTDGLTSIAVHPSGRLVYGTHRSTIPLEGEVVVFDWRARTELTRIGTGWFADEVVVNSAGTTAYLAMADGVGVVDLATNSLHAVISIPEQAYHVALDALGSRLVATGTLVADGVTYGRITVIDTVTEAVTDSIELPDFVEGVAVTPDGSRAYVAASTAGVGDLVVIDTDPLGVVGHVPVQSAFPDSGFEVVALAMHPSGAELYAAACSPGSGACGTGAVLVVDTATSSLRTTIPMNSVRGIAVDPHGKSLWIASGQLVLSYRLSCTPRPRRAANVGFAERVAIRPCTKCAPAKPPCP
jgi:DNA-binding beta-propeller fold protein YncE